jgi:hypothetical protein
MQIALYCPDSNLARSVRGCLNGIELSVFDSRDRFARRAARAHILLIAVERLEEGVLDLLRSVRRVEPQKALLLITSAEPDNAAKLGPVEVDRVVWIDQLANSLPATLREYVDDLPRFRLGRALTAHRGLAAPLRQALVAAIRADSPPRRIGELAQLGGCSLNTFKLQWTRDIAAASGFTRRRLLRLLLLLRLAELRGVGGSWSRAATVLGIELSYAERISRIETGCTLGQLGDEGVERMIEQILVGVGCGKPKASRYG